MECSFEDWSFTYVSVMVGLGMVVRNFPPRMVVRNVAQGMDVHNY